MKLNFPSAVLVLCISLLQAQPKSERKLPIIDVHLHAFPATWSSKHTPFNVITGRPSMATTGSKLLSLTLSELDKHNVQVAILSGPLNSVKEWMLAAPNRFIGAPQFPMTYLETNKAMVLEPYMVSLEKLREAHRKGEISVIGEITAQYVGIEPYDPILEPYFALAEELDIPVAIHTGTGPPGAYELGYPSHRVSTGNPILLEDVLYRHPRLRLYLMHAGYPFLQETITIMHAFPCVYAEFGAINWRIPRAAFHKYLEDLITAGFEKRLMFGSDSEAWPEGIRLAIEGIESADFLTNEQKRDIFYNNAARFFQIGKEKEESN